MFDKKAKNNGLLLGWQVSDRGGKGLQVSQLLFVNGILASREHFCDQLTYFCWLLMWFEAMFGLRVNLDKSELIPMGSVGNSNRESGGRR